MWLLQELKEQPMEAISAAFTQDRTPVTASA